MALIRSLHWTYDTSEHFFFCGITFTIWLLYTSLASETITLLWKHLLLFISLLCRNIKCLICLFAGCNIVSVTSPSASTLNVVWSSYSGASVYLLDLRVVNSTSIAPVVVMQSAPSTQRLIQGLRPGHVYQVTMKVFQFYTVVCTDVELAITGKDT